MAEKERKEDAVKTPDTAQNDEHAQHADEPSEYCTKPFDPENSRSRDADDPCVNGES